MYNVYPMYPISCRCVVYMYVRIGLLYYKCFVLVDRFKAVFLDELGQSKSKKINLKNIFSFILKAILKIKCTVGQQKNRI